jgi:putative ABC transport system permease protein
MLRNFVRVALRSLIKQKVYSSINIVGFAVSISACLLILLYVQNELSFDDFNPKADRIYKVALERIYPEHRTYYSIIPHSFSNAMKKDFPEVENTLMMGGPQNRTVITYKVSEIETKSFEEDWFMLADSSFFEFFDLELVKGDKKTALSKPRQIIITEATAKKYFGDVDPIGKVMGGDAGELTVSAVCKAMPANSHLKFDFLGTLSSNQFFQREVYTSFSAHVYVLLKPGGDAKALEAKFPQMVDTYAAPQIERNLGKSWEDYKKAGNGYRYFLQPLTSIHLDPTNIEGTITPSGNGDYVKILSYVALLILVIACINFMNLATARSAERAREVGVRKTMGSPKSQLIYQFLTESILVAIVATALAVLLAYLLLPQFNSLAQKQLNLTFNTSFLAILTGFALLVGVLAGLYPAFVLSGFNPVVVMKGNFSGSGKGAWMRNGLVVFQFMISIILIVGTLIVGQQMRFMQNKNLGFDKDQVIYIERAFTLDDKLPTFADELRDNPNIKAVGLTSSMVGRQGDFFGEQFQPEGSTEVLTVKTMVADDYFSQMIDFQVADGKFFAEGTNDSLNIILNETAVKTLDLKDPVGRRLTSGTDNNDGTQTMRTFTVIGVVKDFHFQSLRDEITPLVMFSNEFLRFNGFISIRVKPENVQGTIAQIENRWKVLAPGQPFRYSFLDDNIQREYAEEKRSGQLFSVFSGLAIIIACVGLFGLSAYTASLRTKEIGVRKVLGASVAGVTVLLSKDFTKLVLIAFVLAVPVSWWLMNNWLQSFAYRITPGAGSYLLAGLAALSIAWLTVSYQSIKAAMVNPVKSLRSE